MSDAGTSSDHAGQGGNADGNNQNSNAGGGEGTQSNDSSLMGANSGGQGGDSSGGTSSQDSQSLMGQGSQGDGQGQATDNGDEGEFKVELPEGASAFISDDQLSAYTDVAKEAGVSGKGLSALMGAFVSEQQKQLETFEKQSADWFKEVQKDATYGGVNFQRSCAAVNRFIDTFGGGKDLRAFLEQHGLQNNPVLFKAFASAGLKISEGTTTTPTTRKPTFSAKDRPKDAAAVAERRYGGG